MICRLTASEEGRKDTPILDSDTLIDLGYFLKFKTLNNACNCLFHLIFLAYKASASGKIFYIYINDLENQDQCARMHA